MLKILSSLLIVLLFSSCSNKPDAADKKSDDSIPTQVVQNQTADETPVAENNVHFVIAGKESTLPLSMNGMFFKSVSGNCLFSFFDEKTSQSLNLSFDAFEKITEPTDINIDYPATKGNFIMLIPDAKNVDVSYVSVSGKIHVTEINWKEKYISGTFESSAFLDKDKNPTKTIPSISGKFYHCKFSNM